MFAASASPRRDVHGCLHAAGIDIKASKNTAIAAMVSELPTPIIADALNLSPGTVDRWARSLATPWQPYAASRVSITL